MSAPVAVIKKPLEVEAIQFVDRESGSAILDWVGDQGNLTPRMMLADNNAYSIEIPTLEGVMVAPIGWWIIKGIKGEFYPCAPDVFEQSYQLKAEALHLNTRYESNDNWSELALRIVSDWGYEGLGVPSEQSFYLVSYQFILGGWKAMISSTNADGRYYEITYNYDKGEAYVDTYKKTHNHVVYINKEN